MKRITYMVVAMTSFLLNTTPMKAQSPSNTWNPNLPGGKYRNPIIDADYSDPDVCRVGNDYYMTSSSFANFPGLQILHSTDLVNWELIGSAFKDGYPVLPEYQGTDLDWHKKIQHGNYVWAPSIRYHDGWFYIYCGDPDQGLFMTKTRNPRETWSEPVWVMKGKGLIDCCPLWDEDGKAYLSHGCAGSRAGVKSVLFVAPMSPDGTKVIGPSQIVYDGHEDQPTIEGTKFYKRNGYYYIFSPAGGVKYGWQVELRSKNPYGPYEEYVGLAQGKSKINGPHQGAWVDTQNGEDWFLHFQDKHAYGRVVHLQPARWKNDWLVIGEDKDGDGCGDPVLTWKKPNLPSSGNFQPAEDDDFNSTTLGLQWQFEGPYSQYWYFCDAAKSKLRLYGVQAPDNYKNLSDLQNALMQKLPTENFTATAKLKFIPNPSYKQKGEEAGFMIKGLDYAALKFVSTENGCVLRYVTCLGAQKGKAEKTIAEIPVKMVKQAKPYTQKYAVDDIPQPRMGTVDVYVRAEVKSSGIGNNIKSHAQFYYSLDGKKYSKMGTPFEVKEGKWVGAKIGFFNMRPESKNDAAFLDIDWIRFTK
ncbi:glycoside hydrolase family 43 protein [Segatella bryantii]|jgi:beta-xylosidase|uniref:glycoside hydrolase family 43 protein n=1 Tax=Segatella bryantii TaxID=77095 RepID=UPI001EDBA062|nr:glycoside hydrolase 43 family protein [Segatella bryantii]MDR4931384.1 glycoside hydrolase 43 family protein [Segatella bryantii]UKK77125.1 glycoside hydrolase 43 family protein [Segatella bryantii]